MSGSVLLFRSAMMFFILGRISRDAATAEKLELCVYFGLDLSHLKPSILGFMVFF